MSEEKKYDQTAKADGGKLRFTLVPKQIIYAIAKIRKYGTVKYKDPDNWKRVEPDRYWEATLRHIMAAWNDYESVDEESGLMHIEHAACNLAFLLEMIEQKRKEQKKNQEERERREADGWKAI